MSIEVSVQVEDFSVSYEHQCLSDGSHSGAVVTFCGNVRDMNLGDCIKGLTLEHYPGMTEKIINHICSEAISRWSIEKIRIVHRVGELNVGEQIVFVGVASGHRHEAFSACEFIMDNLKTRAPFWKKERTTDSTRWIDARSSDSDAVLRWDK